MSLAHSVQWSTSRLSLPASTNHSFPSKSGSLCIRLLILEIFWEATSLLKIVQKTGNSLKYQYFVYKYCNNFFLSLNFSLYLIGLA